MPLFTKRSESIQRMGFTLVELLVVIAIISLIIALLLPILGSARKSARQAVCLSNTKNIGTATIAYARENDWYIPRGDHLIWFNAFLPYIVNADSVEDYTQVEIYRCPEYPDELQTVCYVNNSWTFYPSQWMWEQSRDGDGRQVHEPTQLFDFQSPAESIYLADNASTPSRPIVVEPQPRNVYNDVWSSSHLPGGSESSRRVALDRHMKTVSCMFLDGSSKPVTSLEMTRDMWRDKRR